MVGLAWLPVVCENCLFHVAGQRHLLMVLLHQYGAFEQNGSIEHQDEDIE